jgi:hypothetical protein
VTDGKWTKEQLEQASRLFGIESVSDLNEAIANLRAVISILRRWDRETSAEDEDPDKTDSE